jgi:hypothetical protein
MAFGRQRNLTSFQEGPYALRFSADGALRSTLHDLPDYRLIDALRDGAGERELRSIFRVLREAMP